MTSAPTHTVLRNWDILHAILNFVHPEDDSRWCPNRSGHRDLAALALVCRVLSDLALSVLWREIDMEKINFLFPMNMIVVGPRGRKSLTRVPNTPQEWERFDVYAPRIRKLSVSPSPIDLFLRLGVQTSTRYSTSHHPFPNLRSLEWSCDPSSIVDAMTFLCPTITEVRLSIFGAVSEDEDDGDDAVAAILRGLGETCPHMRIFEYTHLSIPNRRSKAVEASLIYLIRQCCYLEEITLPVSRNILRSLASLLHLSTLQLDHVKWESGSQLYLPIQVDQRIEAADRFPVLDDLTIQYSHTVSSLTECFRGSGCFPRASFTMWEMTEGEEWSTLAIAEFVRGILRPDRIEGLLVFRIDREPTVEEPVGHDPWQALRCLYSIPNLRTLSLDGLFLDIDDTDLAEISRIWPELQSLTLDVPGQTEDGDDFQSHISFQGLTHLSTLKNLENVSLMLAPESTLSDSMLSPSTLSNSRLKSLTIQGKFPPVTPYAAKMFLILHFPRLKIIKTSLHLDMQEVERMKELQALLDGV